MARYTKEQAIPRIMSGLGCTKEEAEEVYNYDQKIEHDEKTEFDLSPEQNKIAMSFTKTGTRKIPTVYKFQKKERKPNATKSGIVAEIFNFFEKNSDFDIKNLQIPKKEGKISFKVGEKWYSVTLTEHRTKPKDCEGD